MSFIDHLFYWAVQQPDAPAVAKGSVVVHTYSQLASRVAKLAAGLNRFGMKPGMRVVLVVRNTEEFFECLLACWHAGLLPVPTNVKLHAQELQYIIEHSDASMCLVSSTIQLTGVPDKCEVIQLSSVEYERLFNNGDAPVYSSAENDLAWLFYTSGTTGRPKGAMLTHRNLATMCQCYFKDIDTQAPWQAILHPAPLSHGSGLYSLAHLMKGSCQVLPESTGFEPDEVFDLINSWQNCVFFAAPTMIKRLTEHKQDRDSRNLKSIIFGGAPMYREDINAYLTRFGPRLAQLYGQGESPMTITGMSSREFADNTHPRWEHRIVSAGTAQSAVNVCVVNEQGQPLSANEPGEIVVSGPSVMRGYWHDEAATALVLRHGWLWTGDIGSIDEDGYLSLQDRSKDLVISGGSNIYPREVEEVLLTHPLVKEVSVIGRPHADWGEIVVAYLVLSSKPESSQSEDDQLTSELDKLCLDNIARFKRPKIYRTIDELPKNSYGKVLKTRLRELESEFGAMG